MAKTGIKNKQCTPETKLKMSLAKIGTARSTQSKEKQSLSTTGANNINAKTWILLSPDDKLIRTNEMIQFCLKNSINYFSLRSKAQLKDQRRITRGTAKGWSVLSCRTKEKEILID